MKYVEYLTQSKVKTDEALAAARSDEMKAKIGLEIATKDLSVRSNQNKAEDLKHQYPLNTEVLISLLDEIEWERRSIAQLKALSEELF